SPAARLRSTPGWSDNRLGMPRLRVFLVSGLLVATFGCAPTQTVSRRGQDNQLITEEEIEASRAPTAYDVIQKLRANFLSYRGETSFEIGRASRREREQIQESAGRRRHTRSTRDWSSDVCSSDLSSLSRVFS